MNFRLVLSVALLFGLATTDVTTVSGTGTFARQIAAIPEPFTILLLLAGLGLLAGYGWRQQPAGWQVL